MEDISLFDNDDYSAIEQLYSPNSQASTKSRLSPKIMFAKILKINELQEKNLI